MAKIRATIARAERQNAWVLPVNPAAASLAVSDVAPADLDSTITLISSSGVINHLGGVSASDGTALALKTVTGLGGVGYAYSGVVEFDTSGDKVAVGFLTKSLSALVEVDGVLVSKTPIKGTTAASTLYLSIDFGTAAPRRRVRIYCASPVRFLLKKTRHRAWAPPRDRVITALFVGDSYVATTGVSSPVLGFVTLSGILLGFADARACGAGGSGFLAPGGSFKLRDHITDITGTSPDVVILCMGANDGSCPPAAITAEALTCLQLIRAALPDVPIVVNGVWPLGTGPSAGQIAAEGAVSAAVAQLADPRCVFVPICTDPSGPWIFGRGRTGLPYDGTYSVTLTAAPSGSTSGVLSAPWPGLTDSHYSLKFSDGTVKSNVTLTAGSAAVSWAGAVTAGAVVAVSNSTLSGNSDYLLGGVDGSDGAHPNALGHEYIALRICTNVRNAMDAMMG